VAPGGGLDRRRAASGRTSTIALATADPGAPCPIELECLEEPDPGTGKGPVAPDWQDPVGSPLDVRNLSVMAGEGLGRFQYETPVKTVDMGTNGALAGVNRQFPGVFTGDGTRDCGLR